MSVEPVQAFRISDGTCLQDKAAAYHAEMVLLLKALPAATRKGFSLAGFQEALGTVGATVAKLTALKADLDPEEDRKALSPLTKLLDSLTNWLEKAEALRRQMAGETDAETAAKVARAE